MREYRIQTQHRDGRWLTLTDHHNRPYTYKTLEQAKKYGPVHAYGPHKIVYADIEWIEVDDQETTTFLH